MNRSSSRLLSVLLFSGIILAGFAAYFMLWNLVRPYPISARENSDFFTTGWLIKGHNPFALDLHPMFLYVYGIVWACVVYPFALYFGPTPILHRALGDLFTVLGCGMLFLGMRISRVPVRLALFGALLFFSHVAYNDLGGSPNSLGLFLLLSSVVLPYARDFSPASIMGTLLIALLAFYTKAYFVLGAPVVISYVFLFRSKALGLMAGTIFAVLLVGTLWLVNRLFPLYLTDIFIGLYNSTVHYSTQTHVFRVGLVYLPMGIGLVALLGWEWRRSFPGWRARQEAARIDLTHLNQPLLLQPAIGWVTYVFVALGAVYVLKLGHHPGNLLGYVYHLITPFLIWRACIVAGVEAPGLSAPLWFLQATAVLLFGYNSIPMLIQHQRDHSDEWQHATEIISRHHDILNTGAIANILWDQSKPIYDAGLTEIYVFSFDHNPLAIAPAYRKACDAYQATINDKIRNRQFDAVMIFSDKCAVQVMFSRAYLAHYYRKVETFPLSMSFEDYEMEVWEPIPAGG